MRTFLLCLLVFLLACPSPKKPESTMLPNDPAAGVTSPALSSLLTRHWEWMMARNPTWATELGDHRFDDKLSDNSEASILKGRAQNRAWLAEAKKIDKASLSETDQITLQLFVEFVQSGIDAEVCAFEEWSVSSSDNPVAAWNYLPELHKVSSFADAEALISRYQQISAIIDNDIKYLRKGAAQGKFANVMAIKRALAMVEKQLAQPLDEWPLLSPAKVEHSGWTATQSDEFAGSLRRVVESAIVPAMKRYQALLAKELLPNARSEERAGLWALPNGKSCYEVRIQEHTTLKKTAQELHELGLSEIARINEEMVVLGKKLFGKNDLASVIAHLRADDSLYFAEPAEIQKKAEASLAKARAEIPKWFGVLPTASCVVTPIPDYEAPFSTTAYYRQPNPDGSKPGEYFVNLFEPKSRPRFEAEVLAYHESIPGHHLQIAIAQELPALPAFRKHVGTTAFVEGWALYTERLADEMGLYESDLDRMGMLSYDAWRASRLVVDTGLHSLGWSRQQAIDFMMSHTALTELNVKNEVDRYLAWPGQALAYKVGQLEIVRLRKLAQEKLGSSFDIKGFHDAVLGKGAVSLSVLAAQVQRWVDLSRQATK